MTRENLKLRAGLPTNTILNCPGCAALDLQNWIAARDSREPETVDRARRTRSGTKETEALIKRHCRTLVTEVQAHECQTIRELVKLCMTDGRLLVG